MSLTVDQLESYDKSNLEVIRLEFIKLQKKLEKCRDEQDNFSNAAIGKAVVLFISRCLRCSLYMLGFDGANSRYIINLCSFSCIFALLKLH